MWIITKCLLTSDEEYLNRVGVHSGNYNKERFAKADTIPIRLLDDDGEVYYEGRAIRKRILDSSEEYAFEPLGCAFQTFARLDTQVQFQFTINAVYALVTLEAVRPRTAQRAHHPPGQRFL